MFDRVETEICGRKTSVAQLASDSGLSPSYISLLLRGLRNKRISLENLQKLAQALKVDVGRLASELQRRANAAKKD